MRIGILGAYPEDFARLPPPPAGIELHLIERDRAHIRIGHADIVLVMAKFVSHKHWKVLRIHGVPTLVIRGGWSALRSTIESLAKRQQGVDSNE